MIFVDTTALAISLIFYTGGLIVAYFTVWWGLVDIPKRRGRDE